LDKDLHFIGRRIRGWREGLDLSLQELARRADVAPSTIQKVETGQMVPSIAIVMKIARGLDRRPTELISDESEELEVVFQRAKEHSITGSIKKMKAERLSGDLFNPAIEMWRVTVSPGFSSGSESHAYEGEEVIICEAGQLAFSIEDQAFELHEGDTLHFKADLPHRWWNEGDTAARFLITGNFPKGLRRKLHRQIQRPQAQRR
jgi:transcriptional regulator with XRE-family HTH domain